MRTPQEQHAFSFLSGLLHAVGKPIGYRAVGAIPIAWLSRSGGRSMLGRCWTLWVQGFVKRTIDMNGSAGQGVCHVFEQRLAISLPRGVPGKRGPHMRFVNAILGQGLTFPFPMGTCRPVGREADQGQARSVGFRKAGSVVQNRSATGATHRHGLLQSQRHAQRVVRSRTLIQCHNRAHAQGGKSLNQRRIAGARADHHSGHSSMTEPGHELQGRCGGRGLRGAHPFQWTMGSRTARSLLRVSSHSASGLEAAVMPPPA